jgi:predicted DNA-binding transcriptional regulator AlpA
MNERVPQGPFETGRPAQKAERRGSSNGRLPEVVSAVEAAALIGCSERSFHEIRNRDGFPAPVRLFGPLRPRWRVADLRTWVEALPSLERQPTPAYLVEGKRRKRAEHKTPDDGVALGSAKPSIAPRNWRNAP